MIRSETDTALVSAVDDTDDLDLDASGLLNSGSDGADVDDFPVDL